jgi:hypothetical protein
MARYLVREDFIPPLGLAFKLMEADILMSISISGRIIRDGIRAYTPTRTWNAWRKCKVIKTFATTHSARATVGWQRKDFEPGKFYPLFIGEGTGIYGPNRKAILAKAKKNVRVPLMRYQYNGRWVSSHSVRGIRPRRMLEKGYEKALPELFLMFGRTAFSYLRLYKYA